MSVQRLPNRLTIPGSRWRIASPFEVLGWLETVARVRRERQTLRGLDDRMLKDIGISRLDAEREARRSLGDLPGRRSHLLPDFD